jgi:hypothetical protein
MLWVLNGVVVLLLLLARWVAVNRQRRKLVRAGSVGSDLRRAVRLELQAWILSWLLAGLAIVGLIGLVFGYVHLFGPLKPVHEWFQK